MTNYWMGLTGEFSSLSFNNLNFDNYSQITSAYLTGNLAVNKQPNDCYLKAMNLIWVVKTYWKMGVGWGGGGGLLFIQDCYSA